MSGKVVVGVVLCLLFMWIACTYAAGDVIQLTEDGWVLYYTPWCSYSQKQLNGVGWKSGYLATVDCDEYPFTCKAEGITVYPTWKNGKTGQAHAGSIEAADLVETLNNVPPGQKI
jgi:hypothetical protein